MRYTLWGVLHALVRITIYIVLYLSATIGLVLLLVKLGEALNKI